MAEKISVFDTIGPVMVGPRVATLPGTARVGRAALETAPTEGLGFKARVPGDLHGFRIETPDAAAPAV